MKIVGMIPARNESWCLEASLRAALEWCDAVVVFLHACTDDSESVAMRVRDELPEEQRSCLQIAVCEDRKWDEMGHRQRILEIGREMKGTHFAMIDADEILTHYISRARIRSLVHNLKDGEMLTLPLYNLRGSLHSYHANGIWSDRWVSVAFRDQASAHWRGDQFHHRDPFGVAWNHVKAMRQGDAGVMHLWGASERRLKAKHALYAITERMRWPHKPIAEIAHTYGLAFEDSFRWEYERVPDHWWAPGHLDMIDLYREPWQEAEVRRIVGECGGSHLFQGLNLHGIA